MPRRRGRPTPQQSLAVAKGPFIDTLVGAAATARDGLTREAADERDRQVEDAFFRAAAALETFLSEWLVRCVSFNATTFRANYEARAANAARQALDASFEPSGRLWRRRGATVTVEVAIPIAKKHSLDETRALLGALDDNVPIRDTEALVRTARDFLPERYARRARNLGRHHAGILDATIAIRNVIAHRSDRAASLMNDRLASTRLPRHLRRGERRVSASKVGYHLQANAGGRPRFEWYFEELAAVAHALAPTRGRKKKICPWRP
jgi:hypothetical protein